jgi:hypothetical protein
VSGNTPVRGIFQSTFSHQEENNFFCPGHVEKFQCEVMAGEELSLGQTRARDFLVKQ